VCSEANRPSNDVTPLLVGFTLEHIEHSEIINSAEPKRVHMFTFFGVNSGRKINSIRDVFGRRRLCPIVHAVADVMI
jgi:hypothetical protein